MDNIVEAVCKNNITELRKITERMQLTKVKETNYAIPQSEYQIYRQDNNTTTCSLRLPVNGLSLMHIAAFADSLEAFIFLNSIGLKIDQTSTNSYLPIHYACVQGSFEIASYILSHWPEQAKVLPSVELHLIYLATWAGDAGILKLLFDNGADINANQNKSNKSVQQAILSRHVDCLRLLLEKGSKKDVDSSEQTTLMLAIINNEPSAVPLLLDVGENPGFVSPTTKETALSLACGNRYVETVKLLCSRLENVDIDPRAKCRAAVHWICSSKNPEIVRTVLAKGINVNRLDAEDRSGISYLIDGKNEKETIEILEMLYKAGMNLNIKSKIPPLGEFVLAIEKQKMVIEWLLQHGADQLALMPTYNNKTIYDQIKGSSKMKAMFLKWRTNSSQ